MEGSVEENPVTGVMFPSFKNPVTGVVFPSFVGDRRKPGNIMPVTTFFAT
jgi:hypothetical protein